MDEQSRTSSIPTLRPSSSKEFDVGNDKFHNGSLIVSPEEWQASLDSVNVSKQDLNRLVLDYLILEGYRDAAIQFSSETGLNPQVDYEAIQERVQIREAVEGGRVEEAVRRVNEMDPEILDTNPPLLFHLHLLRLIELIRQADIASALSFATTELAPRGAQNPEFLADLEKTMALLAFPELAKSADDTTSTPADDEDPAFAPISALMRRSQRLKVAKELNAAILDSQGQGLETRLSGLVRLLGWSEERMQEEKIVVPPPPWAASLPEADVVMTL